MWGQGRSRPFHVAGKSGEPVVAQPLEEAFAKLMARVQPLAVERIRLPDVLNRVAAEDIMATRAVPHFRRTAMDGYVCHNADVSSASPEHPVRLLVTGHIRMGDPPGAGPDRGEAWSITTGGAMPLRGDRVVPLETARRYGDTLILERPPEAKRHVAEPGEDVPAGMCLLRAGEVVGSGALGAMVACGIAEVAVYRQVRVALMATGDELVEARHGVHALPPPGRVFNTNALVLQGKLQEIGCLVHYRGIVPDRPEALRAAFDEAAQGDYDVILTTGGVSVGPHDKVPRTWLDLGAKRVVGRVDLKPGGPFFAAQLGSEWAVGLSGTPTAALAAYHLLVQPLLLRLAGQKYFVKPIQMVSLVSELSRRTDLMRALWARVVQRERGLPEAEVLTGSAFGTLGGIAQANAMILLPPGTPPLRAGSRVATMLLDRPEDRDRFDIWPARPAPLVIGVVGRSGSGKTTVISGLLQRLQLAGVHAIAIKHAAHGFEVDHPGSDSFRMAESGADVVLLVGPKETVLRLPTGGRELTADEAINLAIVTAEHVDGRPPQVVLVEGFHHAGRPVILVGSPKPDASEHDGIWTTLPPVSELSSQALEEALDQTAGQLRERLRSP